MIRALISMYSPSYAKALVYMFQSTEYEVKPYLKWVNRTKDFSRVMHRRTLALTKAAKLLVLALFTGMLLEILAGALIIYLGANNHVYGGIYFGIVLIIIYPIVWAYLLVVPIVVGRYFISGPAAAKQIKESQVTFKKHTAKKIAVAGSYGKTTMKELLLTVLSKGFKVAATPANKNVSISHAKFAQKLKGDEEILIIEYGEGGPGDVVKFARTTQPTHAVITGIAPAHLDKYKTLKAAGEDIFSVASYLKGKNVYVNNESEMARPFLKDEYELFDHHSALGYKISDIKVGLDGTSFNLEKGRTKLNLTSKLVGRHQVGFLAFVAALALDFGMKPKLVQEAIAETKPFEHRMQPYQLNSAWIIDDTYNGNLEGIKAGTSLLKELKAKRKIYVSPGLVDQGEENETVHIKMGEYIAAAKPDIVILMKNSVTDYISKGLKKAKFQGQVRIEDDPLDFYTNLKHFVAADDLVVMQNDWTDNYN